LALWPTMTAPTGENRRWAALKKLSDLGDISLDYPVPVHYRPEDADDFDARESSLVANIERLPLHPIDQFEEFSRLSERYTPEEIAGRYGITERLVRQRVALGGLHQDIRERIEQAIDLRRWGVKQKKTAGCFVEVDHRGTVSITYGVQNPKDAKKTAKEKASKADADDDAAGDEKPTISASLGLALSQQQTIAAAKALALDPRLALRVAIAALEPTYRFNGVVKLTVNGLSALAPGHCTEADRTFSAVLNELLQVDDETALQRFASAMAPALDFSTYNPGYPPEGVGALLAPIDDEIFLREARAVFDADAYFKAVKADLCHVALDEMGVEAKGRPKKKSELATLCVERAKAQGWLPPQMRKPETAVDPDDNEETQ
jgi:hypothetical protein